MESLLAGQGGLLIEDLQFWLQEYEDGCMGEKTVGARVTEYIRVLGLRKTDFMFPKVKGDRLDRKKYMGYTAPAAFATLESLKK